MIKKTLVIIFTFCLLLSCGKKSDPEYKAQKNINFLIVKI
tara:strand:- start:314 stop:433 length:120 start_codon:yes stop_codon:yes gene_type:complete